MNQHFTAHGRQYVINVGGRTGVERFIRRHGQPYELPLLEHIHDLGLTGAAVDVGANIGNHALWLATVCGLRVEAFEPVFHRELAANVRANQLQKMVTIHPVALGDRDGTARHVGPHGKLDPGSGKIAVRRLDDYDLSDIALLKIDVEGMEAAVLRGAEQTIRRNQPIIFAEEWDTDPHWHDAIAEVLTSCGYEMTHRFDKPEAWTPMGKWEPR